LRNITLEGALVFNTDRYLFQQLSRRGHDVVYPKRISPARLADIERPAGRFVVTVSF